MAGKKAGNAVRSNASGKSLINHALLLFGGKGGVGKTSMASATALYAASQGKKVLVLSTDPAHSLSDSLGVVMKGEVTKVAGNVDALEIDAAALLVEYKKKYGALIKQIADEGTFFSKEDIQEFFDLSLPGMDELMALLKVMDILEEKKYDIVIIDTAPTGHTIRLLELPEVMASYIKVLAEMRQKHRVVVRMMTRRYVPDAADDFINTMHHNLTRLKKTLQDSSTQFVPVMIPERLAVAETERLMKVLRKHSIPVQEIIVNRVVKEACPFCKARRKNQEMYLQEIKKKFSRCTLLEVPLLAREVRGKTLDGLSAILFEEQQGMAGSIDSVKQASSIKQAGSVKQSREEKLSFGALTVKPSTKFLLFGGKGGVGKTSCAAATALKEGEKKKVLIFSTDPAHSLQDSFGVPVGNTVVKINSNVSALEVDSYTLLHDLKKKYKKEIHAFFSSVFTSTTTATIDAPYDRRVMEDLFDLAPPGIDEIMALKTMMDLMKEKTYDLFILDTAPTGHTIRLLEMPEIAEGWASTLLDIQEKYPIAFEVGETLQEMLDAIKKVREVLVDSSRSEFVVVAIPEAMSVLETQDLIAGLKRLKVPVEYVIVNKMVPASDCGFCSAKRSEQVKYVKQLQGLKLKMVGVALFENEVQGKTLNTLKNCLFTV
jgi:arsenite/tail-anchored protein-transporting ATPase